MKEKYNCSHCDEKIEEKVFKYSVEHQGVPLCRSCQKKPSRNPKKTKASKSTPKYDFNYNMIKGRIAESLIEQLFLKLGYRVYRYGMENTIPGIMELLSKVRTEVSNTIRRMPDFVIQDKKGEAYFIEVKFSKDETFSISNLKENKYGKYPFENAFFIVVSTNHIKCLSYNDLKKGKKISSKCHNYLGNIKEFETDKKIIIEFCKYAVKFFTNV